MALKRILKKLNVLLVKTFNFFLIQQNLIMHNFNKSNKVTGVTWLKTSPEFMTIRIKIKPREGILTFPKYNDSPNISVSQNLLMQDPNEITEYIFKWREKVFSRWEINKYSDINKCISRNEMEYNAMIKNNNFKVGQMFSNIEQLNSEAFAPIIHRKNWLDASIFTKLNINKSDITSSSRHLFKSEENIDMTNDVWTVMYIIWDNSDYNEDSQLLYQDQCYLVTLYHNTTNNCLIISPNVNDIEFNPYNAVGESGVIGFEYSVEIDDGNDENEENEQLLTLLKKLDMKLEEKQKRIINFVTPPAGRNKIYLSMEIVSATGFDMDNIYIEYTIKVPDGIEYEGETCGRTHVNKASLTDAQKIWKYGHAFEMVMEYSTEEESPSLTIYLEAISKDWWGRRRTEGYSRLALTLEPGAYTRCLSCVRPEELGTTTAETRRFFIGGYHLINNFNVLDEPHKYETDFRYVTSGDVSVRWHTLVQGRAAGPAPPPPRRSTTQLLRGVDDVLQHYQQAKATLAVATRDLDAALGSGDG